MPVRKPRSSRPQSRPIRVWKQSVSVMIELNVKRRGAIRHGERQPPNPSPIPTPPHSISIEVCSLCQALISRDGGNLRIRVSDVANQQI